MAEGIARPPSSCARKVLVVDDEIDVTNVLIRVLEEAGYVARGLHDPRAIREGVREVRPDIIVLDMDLRTTVGTDVCLLLKEMPETSATPVIFLSGLDGKDLRALGHACGAAAYVAKSPNPSLLLQEIARCLGPAADGTPS